MIFFKKKKIVTRIVEKVKVGDLNYFSAGIFYLEPSSSDPTRNEPVQIGLRNIQFTTDPIRYLFKLKLMFKKYKIVFLESVESMFDKQSNT